MTTPHTLEELVNMLRDGRQYYFSSEELNKLGVDKIIIDNLSEYGPTGELTHGPIATEGWGLDPAGGIELAPAHDPVDMIKTEPPSDAEMALVEISAMVSDAAEDLQRAEPANTPSWLIEHDLGRAQAQAQIAQAQAQYATALQLQRIADLMEDNLSMITENLGVIAATQ